MTREQAVRKTLFYISVLIFCVGLPFIISFALGYKFDRRFMKFTKTGLIVLKSQPSGANIYLNGSVLKEKTPYTIDELLPGSYRIELAMTGYYPYSSDIRVEAGKVARLEKVILFPYRPEIEQLNKEAVTSFWIDEGKADIYYVNSKNSTLYKSDREGSHFEKLARFIPLFPAPKKWRLSPDREKIVYFNWQQIGVIYLMPQNDVSFEPTAILIRLTEKDIEDVFWYSDSYHLVVVSDSSVDIIEAVPNAKAVTALKLNTSHTASAYDSKTDTLFFLDTQQAPDGNTYDNLYKLDLGRKQYLFQDLKIRRQNE